jgi:hypothetical protein
LNQQAKAVIPDLDGWATAYGRKHDKGDILGSKQFPHQQFVGR